MIRGCSRREIGEQDLTRFATGGEAEEEVGEGEMMAEAGEGAHRGDSALVHHRPDPDLGQTKDDSGEEIVALRHQTDADNVLVLVQSHHQPEGKVHPESAVSLVLGLAQTKDDTALVLVHHLDTEEDQ